jgi:hypothetical protein
MAAEAEPISVLRKPLDSARASRVEAALWRHSPKPTPPGEEQRSAERRGSADLGPRGLEGFLPVDLDDETPVGGFPQRQAGRQDRDAAVVPEGPEELAPLEGRTGGEVLRAERHPEGGIGIRDMTQRRQEEHVRALAANEQRLLGPGPLRLAPEEGEQVAFRIGGASTADQGVLAGAPPRGRRRSPAAGRRAVGR